MRRSRCPALSLLALALLALPLARSAQAQTPPDNDLCADAITITSESTPFTNVNATLDGPIPSGAFGGLFGADVWYEYTASGNVNVTVSTCVDDPFTTYDTSIAVYSGSCNDLTEVASNDDFCDLQSKLTFTASADETYLIQVGGFVSNQDEVFQGAGFLSVVESEPL
ncbi:MAG: hypothetical protein ACYTGR_11335, partial [Planctomycetota bacterium]